MTTPALNLNATKAYLPAPRPIRRPAPLLRLITADGNLFHAWRP